MWDFLDTVDRADVVEGVDGGGQTTVQAEDLTSGGNSCLAVLLSVVREFDREREEQFPSSGMSCEF